MKRLAKLIKRFFEKRNLFFWKYLYFDFLKIKARFETNRMVKNYLKKHKKFPTKLHLGCGKKVIKNFLNVDIQNSEINIDFSNRKLPFRNNSFEVIL